MSDPSGTMNSSPASCERWPSTAKTDEAGERRSIALLAAMAERGAERGVGAEASEASEGSEAAQAAAAWSAVTSSRAVARV
eukprot:6820160-Prymnesium_polylepis.1